MTIEWFPAMACVASLALKYVFAVANKKREAALRIEIGELRRAEKQRGLAQQHVQFLETELKQTGSRIYKIQKNVSQLDQVVEGLLAEEQEEEDGRKNQKELIEESRRLREKR